MSEENAGTNLGIMQRVSDLVAVYVSNNQVPMADVPALISSVHTAVSRLAANNVSSNAALPAEEIAKSTPSQIKKSIGPDGLVSFIDGKTYKTLKRHLTKHGLTPDKYRARYGLPIDYPVVAASYSEKRSSLAKELQFGHAIRRRAEDKVEPVRKGR